MVHSIGAVYIPLQDFFPGAINQILVYQLQKGKGPDATPCSK